MTPLTGLKCKDYRTVESSYWVSIGYSTSIIKTSEKSDEDRAFPQSNRLFHDEIIGKETKSATKYQDIGKEIAISVSTYISNFQDRACISRASVSQLASELPRALVNHAYAWARSWQLKMPFTNPVTASHPHDFYAHSSSITTGIQGGRLRINIPCLRYIWGGKAEDMKFTFKIIIWWTDH